MLGEQREVGEAELMSMNPDVQKFCRAYKSKHCARERIVEYILQVGNDFGLSKHTTWTTIYYFDRVMLKLDSHSLMTWEQLALTCLLIAAKFIECESPGLDQLCRIIQPGISRNMLKHFELEVLGLLSWNLQVPAPHLHVHLLVTRITGPMKQELLSLQHDTFYFIDLSVLDVSFYAWEMRIIAIASLVAASYLVAGKSNSQLLAKRLCAAYGVDKVECQRCSSLLLKAHRCVENSTSSVFAPIKESPQDRRGHSPDTVVDYLQ